MKYFDAIIIGTGQAGPSLAARFAGAGKTVAIIEPHKRPFRNLSEVFLFRGLGASTRLHGGAQSGAQQLPNERHLVQLACRAPDCKYLKTSEGGENGSFAKPLYWLIPVPRVRIPPSPP